LPLIFNVWAVTCLEREEKPEHSVGEEGVAWHAFLLQQTLLDAPQEAWNHIHVCGETDMDAPIEVAL
jgi:hypothetical protein